MKLHNPWPTGRSINKNSPYGWRVHPISGKRKFHNGVDVAGSFPVTAAGDGVVTKIGWSPSGGGHTVLIDHGEIVTVYYHGAHKTALRKGQRVEAGAFVYTSGSTGASTGAHLHFEVRKRGGAWGSTLDPVPYLVTEAPAVPEPVVVEVVEPEPVRPEPMKPAKPAPKWTPSAALQRGFKRLRGAVK